MRVLALTDRLCHRGGADQHLQQMLRSAVAAGYRVVLGCGRLEAEAPTGVEVVLVRGLSSPVANAARLARLEEMLAAAEVVHVQNVMNPVALRLAVATGRAVVTIQDHRVLCPGPGRTLPNGARCTTAMSDGACRACLPDGAYRERMLGLTAARCDALRGARLVVLSHYMADELTAAGLPGALVLPPWVEPGPERFEAGQGFVLGGRLVAHKAPLDGWRAWREAGSPQPLSVAGTGPLECRLVGAERLGWLSADRLRRTLRSARALLFPARWQEPFGILGVEALAEGTPVVVAEAGGTADWSEAGCLRVAPGDVDAMADAIGRLATDPDLALRLGRGGQTAVAERFSRARLEPPLHALWHAVARGAPAGEDNLRRGAAAKTR